MGAPWELSGSSLGARRSCEYIEVALVHGCHLPVHVSVQSVKMYQPLSSYIYKEAVCLFNIFIESRIV
jgi:hypothetical protein